MFPLGNISTLESFSAQDAADDLLKIGAKNDVKLQEDLVIVTGMWNSTQINANSTPPPQHPPSPYTY